MEHSNSKSEEERKGMVALRQLVKLLKETLEISGSVLNAKQNGGINMLMKYIIKYKNLIEAENAEFITDQAPLFKELFYKNRSKFLAIIDDDTFIYNGNLQVWYGEHVRKVRERNIRLPISSCYKKAFDIKEITSSKLNDDPDNDAKVMESTEYAISGEIKHFLIKTIFYSLDDGSLDREALDKLMEELILDTTLSEDDEEVPGTSLSSVVGKLAKNIGGKDVKIDNSKIKETTNQLNETLGDKDFTDALKEALIESNKNKPESLSASIGNVLTRVGPKIDKMAARNNSKRPPKGATVVDEKMLDQHLENTQKQIQNIANAFS